MLLEFIEIESVEEHQVSSLYLLSQKSLITAIIFTLFSTLFLYEQLSYTLFIWATILISILLLRLYDAYIFTKNPTRYSTIEWYERFILFAFVTGFFVSSLGFYWIHYLNSLYQLFIITALVGLSAGATVSLSSDFRMAIIYLSIIILPLIISSSLIEVDRFFILPILLTLFFFSQVLMLRNSHTLQETIKELERGKQPLQNLFTESPLGMIVYNKESKIIDANEAIHAILHYQTKNFTGKELDILPHEQLITMFKNVMHHSEQKELQLSIEHEISTSWITAKGFPFKNENDEVIGGIGILEDKTQAHNDEQSRLLLNSELQKQVEKNQFLLNENRDFIANMVHQIRTPLSVIMLNAELIEASQANEKVTEFVEQMTSAINMLSNSYEDLFYIISHDVMSYPVKEIECESFLVERIEFFKLIAHAHEKNIEYNIDKACYMMMNDTELERLIDNNISNAIKYSEPKSTISIALFEQEGYLFLNFTSRGETIKDSVKIFEKNYTESSSSKRSLGLGLSMVKSICEKNSIFYRVDAKERVNLFSYRFNLVD